MLYCSGLVHTQQPPPFNNAPGYHFKYFLGRHLSIHLSIYLSIHLSIYLSVYLHIHDVPFLSAHIGDLITQPGKRTASQTRPLPSQSSTPSSSRPAPSCERAPPKETAFWLQTQSPCYEPLIRGEFLQMCSILFICLYVCSCIHVCVYIYIHIFYFCTDIYVICPCSRAHTWDLKARRQLGLREQEAAVTYSSPDSSTAPPHAPLINV